MSKQQIKITVPGISARNWKTLVEVKAVFSEEEIVTMVHRYCDAQDHARNYRQKHAERVKAVMSRAKEEGWVS